MNKYGIDSSVLKKACQFTGAWIGNAFSYTKSLEAKKYYKLVFKISKCCFESKKHIEVNYIEKKFKITNKVLDNTQLKAVEFIMNNQQFIANRVNEMIIRFEKKLIKEQNNNTNNKTLF